MVPAEDLPNFCIKIRLEGKDGTKRVRIPYNPAKDTHETLLNAILERYLPAEKGFLDPSDFVVKLKEIGDPGWPIDVENTKDIALAIGCTPKAKEERHLKMCAYIRLKSDPEPLEEESACPPSAAAAVTDHAPIAVAAITPAAGGSAGKKRRVVSSSKPTKRRVSGGGKGAGMRGSKLPVRARIIGSIAELRALGKPNPPRIHVAMFAGYSNAASKGFSNPLSALKTEGLVSYPDKSSVALTEAGLASPEARAVAPPRNNAEVHARVKALLTPKQCQIFDLLAQNPKVVHDRDRTAAAVGYSNPASKGWSNSISKMSSLGLLHYPKDANDPKKKLLQLTEMCCPFGDEGGFVMGVNDDDDDDHYDDDDGSEQTAPYGAPGNGETAPDIRMENSTLDEGMTPYASHTQVQRGDIVQVKSEETTAAYDPAMTNVGMSAAAPVPEVPLSSTEHAEVVEVQAPYAGIANRFYGGYQPEL